MELNLAETDLLHQTGNTTWRFEVVGPIGQAADHPVVAWLGLVANHPQLQLGVYLGAHMSLVCGIAPGYVGLVIW